ncbi:NRDE family protein [Alteromonas sp. a30]|uniref:NRDE family protein n=1 Tax=Alteromonas sp. a30 TaxID=2730917 RepID=UPI002281E081|nr:NRDE family protein [Alteromonas sp. a30]MCY7293958.1 NRDE family protein [Alteromonas sp. a30]
MCILFLAVNQHPRYPLIIAANRDEFYARPTAASQFWEDSPDVLAGRDLEAGGTWMGMNKNGRLAALTNIRAPSPPRIETRTRGELISNFLNSATAAQDYARILYKSFNRYRGYNLLFGHWDNLRVYNNHLNRIDNVKDGYYGLSNAWLDSPWPKIESGKANLEQICSTSDEIYHEDLFDLLRDETKAPEAELPQTGIPSEHEKQLSSIFINIPDYGTRSSTVLTVNEMGHVNWFERTFNEMGDVVGNDREFKFNVAPSRAIESA